MVKIIEKDSGLFNLGFIKEQLDEDLYIATVEYPFGDAECTVKRRINLGKDWYEEV